MIGYPTSGSAAGFKLSSGMASSMHGDAFFAWDDKALGSRVKNCIDQRPSATRSASSDQAPPGRAHSPGPLTIPR